MWAMKVLAVLVSIDKQDSQQLSVDKFLLSVQ